MNEAGLLKLKQEIDAAKTATSELKGQLTTLMKQLKKDWGCNSIEEAEKLSKKMNKDMITIDNKIKEGLKELEEKYGT